MRLHWGVRESMTAFSAVLSVLLFGCSPRPPAHGIAFAISIETNVPSITASSNLLQQTATVIRGRVESLLGLPVFIERTDSPGLLVKVRELNQDELKTMRELLTRRGLLEFCMVHPKTEQLVEQGLVPPGYRVMEEQRAVRFGTNKTVIKWLVKTEPERGLTARYLLQILPKKDPMTGAGGLDFELNDEGARLFQEITSEFQPRGGQYFQLAIVFDGEIAAVPRLMAPIPNGRGSISGNFNLKEATVLSTFLSNPLEAKCRIVQEQNF